MLSCFRAHFIYIPESKASVLVCLTTKSATNWSESPATVVVVFLWQARYTSGKRIMAWSLDHNAMILQCMWQVRSAYGEIH